MKYGSLRSDILNTLSSRAALGLGSMNAYELCRELKEKHPTLNVPIVKYHLDRLDQRQQIQRVGYGPGGNVFYSTTSYVAGGKLHIAWQGKQMDIEQLLDMLECDEPGSYRYRLWSLLNDIIHEVAMVKKTALARNELEGDLEELKAKMETLNVQARYIADLSKALLSEPALWSLDILDGLFGKE